MFPPTWYVILTASICLSFHANLYIIECFRQIIATILSDCCNSLPLTMKSRSYSVCSSLLNRSRRMKNIMVPWRTPSLHPTNHDKNGCNLCESFLMMLLSMFTPFTIFKFDICLYSTYGSP